MSAIAIAEDAGLELAAAPRPLLARLDPRSRVLALVGFALAMVGVTTLGAALGGLAAAALLAVLARLAVAPTLRRMAALEGFMLLTLATLPFTMGGAPLAQWGGLVLGAEGVERAALILTKANAVVLATLALVGAMEASALGHALARLRLPVRLVALFLFTARYVDVLHREYGRLRLAMRARGFRPAASLHCWRSLGYLVGMLLVSSLERSERIHAAMRLRGFDGRFHFLDEHRPGRLDWGFGAAMAATVALLAVLDLT